MKFSAAAVIGLGHFGARLCDELSQAGVEVIGIDKNRVLVEEMRDRIALPVQMDSRDPLALKGQDLVAVGTVIVAIGDSFEDSVLTIAHLRELEVPRIIARIINPVHEKILRTMGITELIQPEQEGATSLARRLQFRKVRSCTGLSSDWNLVEVDVPDALIGKDPATGVFEEQHGLRLVAVQSGEGGEIDLPRPGRSLAAGDILTLFGPTDRIRHLLR